MKIGDKIFSPQNGFLEIEATRGKGRDREVMFRILEKEYWIPERRIQ
jgi:hypothetical protein